MPREPRYHDPGAYYHVIARGNHKQVVFPADSYYLHYLALLQKYSERFTTTLHAYVLMNNHVHLLLQVGEHPLSRFMQGVQQSYTQYVNQALQQTGHLFQGRYKAIFVDRDEYLLALVNYIHQNPVKAGLVTDPANYRWSSHSHYIHGSGEGQVETREIGALVGRYRGAEIPDYEHLDLKPITVRHAELENKELHQSEVNRLAQNANPVPLSAILRHVNELTGVDANQMQSRRQDRVTAMARRMFFYVASKEGHALNQIAQYVGRTASSVTIALQEIDDDLRRGGEWRDRLASINC